MVYLEFLVFTKENGSDGVDVLVAYENVLSKEQLRLLFFILLFIHSAHIYFICFFPAFPSAFSKA